MRKLAFLAVAALLVFPLSAAADWTTFRSANFTYIGDASEGQMRDVARRLEQFREVMLSALSDAKADSPVPTVVVVFRNEGSFRPFMPMQDGKVVQVGGYFQPSRDVNYIALNVEFGPLSYPAIFHEYAHFLTRNNAGELPLWLNEGLAGVYESFEMRDGNRSAYIGIVQAEDLRILSQQRWLTLAELNAVKRESPIYNGDRQRGLFYAQSWALTHYLMISSPARASQFKDYLARIENGEPSETALPAALGDLKALQDELRGYYLRQQTFPAYRYNFEQRVTGATVSTAEKVPDYEAQGYLGDMLGRIRGATAGRVYLINVLGAKPDAARASAALGSLEARESNIDAALPLLEKAVAANPRDASYQAALGRALFAQVQGSVGSDGDPQMDAQRTRAINALTTAFELNPKVAEVAAMLGYIHTDLTQATTLMKQAIVLEPSREDYRLLLANLMARNRDLDGATQQLGILMARGSTQEVRDSARGMMGQIAEIRQRINDVNAMRARAEAAASSAAAAAPASAPTAAGTAPAAVDVRPGTLPAGPGRPEMLRVQGSRILIPLRPVGAGEARVLGMFTAIECSQGSVVLVIEAEGGAKRLIARNLTAVDFISYRESAPSGVGCGRQQAGRVFATYRPTPGNTTTDGAAVAIELLPDNVILP